MKKCCKLCKNLNYYDGYFCTPGYNMDSSCNKESDYRIENIETSVCQKFKRRIGKFWLYDNSGF